MTDDTRALALKVLEDGYLMSLGVADGEGPWVADLVYIHDDAMNLYWASMPHSRHGGAIEGAARAAVAITADHAAGKERGLQLSGMAERLAEAPADIARRMSEKHPMPVPPPGAPPMPPHEWFKFTPSRIEIIDAPHFGYARQRVL